MDFLDKVIKFNELGGNLQEYDARKVNLYIGLLLEEAGELIDAYNGVTYLEGSKDRADIDKFSSVSLLTLGDTIAKYSDNFKNGQYDFVAPGANHEEVVDAFIDCAVIGVGGVMTNGYDAKGAANEVADANMSKYWTTPTGEGEYLVELNEFGKIKKGPYTRKPDFTDFKLS